MSRLITILLFLTSVLAVSQTKRSSMIIGRVVSITNEPLLGATIILKNTTFGTLTDENGKYSLQKIANGNHTIMVSYIGFKTIIKNISITSRKRIKLDFVLEENPETLDEVIVKGKSKETQIETKGFAVNAVKTKEASLRNIQTNELLNTTVGVKIRQNGGLGSRVSYSLNGLSGNSVRIFIDGIPISTYGSSFNLNSIPPSMIKNIEVYKGVVPGHLADDALGGAINIVLHNDAKTNFNASVSYGSFNTLQTSINGLYRFEKSGFTVKASLFHNYSDNNYKVSGRSVVVTGLGGVQTPITAKRFNDAYKSTGGMAQIGFTNVKWQTNFLLASDFFGKGFLFPNSGFLICR